MGEGVSVSQRHLVQIQDAFWYVVVCAEIADWTVEVGGLSVLLQWTGFVYVSVIGNVWEFCKKKKNKREA